MPRRIYSLVNSVRSTLMISVSVFTVLLCLLQVILRYFTIISLRPFAWGDEIIRLSAIWVIFLGISVGIRENAHFSVELFLNKVRNPKTRNILVKSLDILAIVVFLIVMYQGYRYTITNLKSWLQNIRISMAWFYAAIPVGALLCIFEYVFQLIYGKGYKQKMLAQKSGQSNTKEG